MIDAIIEAAAARTDAKFAQVLAKLDTLTTEVRESRSSIWTAAFVIIGLIFAVVAIIVSVAPSAFSTRAQLREIAREESRAAAPAAASVPEAIATPEPVPAKKP